MRWNFLSRFDTLNGSCLPPFHCMQFCAVLHSRLYIPREFVKTHVMRPRRGYIATKAKNHGASMRSNECRICKHLSPASVSHMADFRDRAMLGYCGSKWILSNPRRTEHCVATIRQHCELTAEPNDRYCPSQPASIAALQRQLNCRWNCRPGETSRNAMKRPDALSMERSGEALSSQKPKRKFNNDRLRRCYLANCNGLVERQYIECMTEHCLWPCQTTNLMNFRTVRIRFDI